MAATYRNPGGFAGVASYALDKDAAQKLWTLSEELTHTKFDI